MKDWDIEKLQRYKKQLDIINIEFSNEASHNRIEIDRANQWEEQQQKSSRFYYADAHSISSSSYQKDSYKYTQEYTDAVETIKNEFGESKPYVSSVGVLDRLNEVNVNLAIKYLHANNIDEAAKALSGLDISNPKRIDALAPLAEVMTLDILTELQNQKFDVKRLLSNKEIFSKLLPQIEKAELMDKNLLDTMLESALQVKNGEGAKILVGKGAQIPKDALKTAIIANASLDIIELLATKTPKPELTDLLGQAVMAKRSDVQPLLIKHGANVNNIYSKGQTLLPNAIRNKDEATVRNLLLNGANIHLNEEILKEELDKTSKEIKTLMNTYIEMENYFKAQVMPKISEMAESLNSEQGITNTYVIEKLNGVLEQVYGKSLQNENINKEIKLDFIEQALVSIKAAFASIISTKTFEQIKFEKMAEAIYEKIQGTQEFKNLAIPAASMNLAEFEVDQKNITNAENIAKRLALKPAYDLYNSMKKGSDISTDVIQQIAEACTKQLVDSLVQGQGAKLDEKAIETIKSSITEKMVKVVEQGHKVLNTAIDSVRKDNSISANITLKDLVNEYGGKFTNEVNSKIDRSKLEDSFKNITQDAKAMIDKEMSAAKGTDMEGKDPKVVGKYTSHLQAQRNQAPQQDLVYR